MKLFNTRSIWIRRREGRGLALVSLSLSSDENEDFLNMKHSDPWMKEGASGYAPAPLSTLG
jgi:hypothetical protein